MTLLNVPGTTLVPAAPVLDLPTGLRLLALGFWSTS